MTGAATTGRPNEKQQERERTFAEWVTFGVATLVLLGVLGLIIYDWRALPSSPAMLEVQRVGQAERAGEQYLVHFKVSNSGGETVGTVQVVAELRRGGEVITAGEQQIDFLSPGESEEGAFLFKDDPDHAELELRVASYTLP